MTNEVPQPKMVNSKEYRDNYSEINWGKDKTKENCEENSENECICHGSLINYECPIHSLREKK